MQITQTKNVKVKKLILHFIIKLSQLFGNVMTENENIIDS